MSDDNDKVDINDDQEAFESAFFSQEEPEKAEAEEKEVETEEETPEVDEVEEDDPLATEDEDEEVEEEDEEQDEEEPEPEPKPKRNKTQERIEKLVAEAREAQRKADALEKRLAELEAGKEVKKTEEAPTLREQLPADAPNPDAKGEDGEPLYPLGEFDPTYIRDLTKFTIEQETKAAKEAAAREAQEEQIRLAREEITNNYIAKLDEYEKEVPEVRENIRTLTEVFSDIEPAYGEYLAATLMASEYSPQIMNYLSQNIGEAQRIVAAGPAAATLAIGRLEARFMGTKEEPKRNIKKVSDAPSPPENRTRGQGGKFAVSPDTDDQDAFEREFFTKK